MRPAAPLPADLLDTARHQAGLLEARQCDAAGVGSDRRRALRRAGLLLPVLRGVHDAGPSLTTLDPGWAGLDAHDLARHRAAWTALLAVGRSAAVATGACALVLLGVDGLPVRVRPEAARRDGTHRAPGGGVRVRCVEVGRVDRVGAAHVVHPIAALAQAVCELDREHAVAVLDSALQRRVLRADEVDDVRRRVVGRRGSRRTASWWALVDGRAESPLETRARLQCHDAGLPPDDLQVRVVGRSGRVVARADLGWWRGDGRLVVAEIDGAAPHSVPDALFRDRWRQNDLVAEGVVVLRFTAADVRDGRVAPEVVHHLGRGTRR